MRDTQKKLREIVDNMRRKELLNHAKRTFPHGTPQESFINELLKEAHRRARRHGPQNKVWNVDGRLIIRSAEQIYQNWLEWSDKDEGYL